MKKSFTLWVALMFISFASAEIYEIGADGNDNAITLTTGGIDNGDIVINIGLTNPTANIVGMDTYLDFTGGNDKISTDVELSNRCNRSYNATTGIVTKAGENEGLLYLAVVSTSLTSLSGTDGTVATIYLTEVEEGQYELTVKGMCYDETNTYNCAPVKIVFIYANGTITLVQDEADEYSNLVFSTNDSFAATASGTFPVGWVANDNGTIHQYGLTDAGDVWNYNWGGNVGGGGCRSMTGYSGDLNGAAIYWRNLNGDAELGTLTYGEQVKDYILEDGTLDPEMPEGISLYLDAHKYQITIRMCAWKNLNGNTDAVSPDDAPKYDFTLEDMDGNVHAHFGDIMAMPNVNGQQSIEVTDVVRSQFEFTVNKAAYYILKFSTTQANGEYLLGGVDLMSILSEDNDDIMEDSLIILTGDTLLLDGQRFPDNYGLLINNGTSLTLQGNEGMVPTDVTLAMDMQANDFAQILSSTNLITVTGDLCERIYTQGMTWNFLSLPFDCDLSRMMTEDGTAYAIRYYDGASRAAKNVASGNWKNYGKNDIIPMGTGFIYMTQNDTWTQFYAVNNESKNHVFQSTSGTTILSMERNESVEPAHSGWNLLGNPYANYYSIHAMNFDKAVTYWNGNTYEVCFPNDDDMALKPNQAFFVQCPENTFGITMPGSGRQLTSEISSGAKARRIAMNKGKSRKLINLSLSDSEFTDKTRVVLNEEASMDYELECDASKFMSMRPEVPQLYSLGINGTKYAVNERPMNDGTVKLGLYIPTDGNYTLTMTRNDAEQILLTDSETGQTVDLTDGSYSFYAKKGTYNNRLILTFGTVTGMYNLPCTMYNLPCGEEYFDLSGRRISKPTKAGIYLLKQGKTVQKVQVK